jgi:dolichyl-phosphate beta-glucosyltransferase
MPSIGMCVIQGVRGCLVWVLETRTMLNQPAVRLSVIIPAFNEKLRLPHTLSESMEYLETQSYNSEIIVVNDGSTDGTERVVREQRSAPVSVRLLTHADGANHGKGASVKLGMLESSGVYRLFMDADNSTTLDQVDRFWPFFSRGYDVVIGSRALKNSVIGMRQAWYKELAGRIGNKYIRAFAVPGISDTQAGFKMFAGEKAEAIFSLQTIDRWGFDIELLAIARSKGYRIGEVPITWVNASGSKVLMRSYLEVLGEVWRVRKNLKAGLYK